MLAGAVALTAVAGCGAISIKPDPVLPQPLLQPLPGSVGLVLPNELRNYVHKERRWGADWLIALGPGHVHLLRDVFRDSFRQVQEFKDLAAARAATGLNAVFEPLIDQYSFVTDRDTGHSRGFGFIEMPDQRAAQSAIAGLQGKELGGRALTVNEAKPREPRR